MIIAEIIVHADGTQETRERELTPEEIERLTPSQPEPEESDPMEAVDAMLVDHEYRLTLMELGINGMET